MENTIVRLLLVRHGLTLSNVQERYTGQSDVPLTEMGERQAEAVGKRLATEALDVIVSSDLQRAHATAGAIARYHNLPVCDDADLREASLGEWEGLTYSEVIARYRELVRHRREDPNVSAPGGESFMQLRDRVARARTRWQSHYPNSTMVWVTHAGIIEVSLCLFLGIDLKHRRQFHHSNASITEFDLSRDYGILVSLNNTEHLRMLEDGIEYK
ncbi:MAG TPA: histidine phosphatase family protein [Ktedonobacteraceae bacterium]|nr:histidine phosphatase family protein [Ktedonobacteraceae bacterium]